VPGIAHGAPFTRFMKVGNSVLRDRAANVTFGVESVQRVRVRLYDVGGRVVRTLADRTFAAGEQSVAWDGADDGGRQVARGVYFARIEYAAKGQSLSGRVVVLR
jgi:flagellar hook assembly protein FlgD